MSNTAYIVRNALPAEFKEIGELMVSVYSQLEGFPTAADQPCYYRTLAHVGEFTTLPGIELLTAVSGDGRIAGAVVYFNEMKNYGSGGTATQEKNACGFRLLAVANSARGQGIGKLLVRECIQKARHTKAEYLIIHSTRAMQTAWHMYEKMGFERSADLDFLQSELPVYGFRLRL